ncbi:MAG: ATP-binding cassette domain-containing protein, partial [Armatimonadia bacterium]|nr:ATP-binding cassette domain-containing protein [Armatimonadia bacterium]
RKRAGLVLSMDARANLTLPVLGDLSTLGWIHAPRERALVDEYFARLRVRASGPEAPANALSGGNQQKLVLARWLAANCDVLLLDEPTRGVDVGAKAEIHDLIARLASDGAAILLISSELPEVLNLSTRLLVLRAGRVVAQLDRDEADQERVLRLMTGLDDDARAG